MGINVMYLRKSREDIEAEQSGQGETLTRHYNALMELSKRLNMPVTEDHIYREIVSGDTIVARPEIQKVLRLMEQGEVDNLLVYDVDRLSRGNMSDQGRIFSTVFYMKVNIVTPDKIYNPCDPSDSQFFEMKLFFARIEYNSIKKRLIDGRVKSFNQGLYIPSVAPYGYNRMKVQKGKGYTLTPNEQEAPYLRMMYDMAEQGIGVNTIADKLNKLGVPTRHGSLWTGSVIKRALQNPHYIGKVVRGIKSTQRILTDGVETKKVKRNEKSKIEIVDGIHEPLITEEQYYKVQSIRLSNTKTGCNDNKDLKNELAGIMKCGCCGKAMIYTSRDKKYPGYLKCRYNCGNKQARHHLVVERVLDALKEWYADYTVESVPLVRESQLPLYESTLAALKDELTTVDGQIDSLCDLLEKGVYSLDMYNKRSETLFARKKKIDADIVSTKELIENEKTFATDNESFAPKVERLFDMYDDIDTVGRNLLFKEVLEKVEFWKSEDGMHNFTIKIYPKMPRK
jgi:DNA invertase Pin-like site-specific DNA recombinase